MVFLFIILYTDVAVFIPENCQNASHFNRFSQRNAYFLWPLLQLQIT